MRKYRIPLHNGYRARSFDPDTITEREWGYLAALIDGEGSILWRNSGTTKAWAISITNTDLKMLNWCKRFGGGVYPTSGSPLSKKPQYVWINTRARDLMAIFDHTIPSLTTKKRKAIKANFEIDVRFWGGS